MSTGRQTRWRTLPIFAKVSRTVLVFRSNTQPNKTALTRMVDLLPLIDHHLRQANAGHERVSHSQKTRATPWESARLLVVPARAHREDEMDCPCD